MNEPTQETPEAPVADTTTAIEDVSTFARVFAIWHNRAIATLTHMQQIPPGTEVSVDDSEKKALVGEYLAGFQLGLDVAMLEIKKTPFVIEFEDAPAMPH